MLVRTLMMIAAVACTVPAAPAAHADKASVYTGLLDNFAAGGHDVVAYFTASEAVPGKAEFEVRHDGAQWRFSSAANLAAFTANPDKYAPQFGGYCAWAVSQNYTAKGDPRYWKIVGGKLYLNYDARIQKRWEADIPGFVKSADANWPAVLKK